MKLASLNLPVTAKPLPSPSQRVESGELLAFESKGSDKVTLVKDDGQALEEAKSFQLSNISLKTLKEKATSGLLPSNLETSVSADYLTSRKWNAVRTFAGSITSYMGTAAALNAVGVGSGPLTVGMAWMLRDSVDGVGKFVGSMHAKEADRDPKGMIVKGELIQNAGVVLESALAIIPGAFLAVGSSAQVVKALGASYRTAAEPLIDAHQAIDHNLAEIKAKNSNQDLVINTIGGATAFGLDQLIRNTVGPVGIPIVTAGAAALKVWASHKYVESLSLNMVSERPVWEGVAKWLGEEPNRHNGLKRVDSLQLGAPVEHLTKKPERFRELTQLYSQENYLLDRVGDKIEVVVNKDASEKDQLRAVFQAGILQKIVKSDAFELQSKAGGEDQANRWAVELSLKALPSEVEPFFYEQGHTALDYDKVRFEMSDRVAEWKKGDAAAPQPISVTELKQQIGQ